MCTFYYFAERYLSEHSPLRNHLNLVIVSQNWHQALVDSWVPLARQLKQSFPDAQFYETPVIQKMNVISQTFINERMRASIPNQTTREKTITLYIDKKALRSALEIPNEDTIWVLVLDKQWNVLWRAEGTYSQEKGEALLNTIREHSAVNKPASS
jgi:predicted transcriptional regulator